MHFIFKKLSLSSVHSKDLEIRTDSTVISASNAQILNIIFHLKKVRLLGETADS